MIKIHLHVPYTSFTCRLRSIINGLPRGKEADAYVWLSNEGPTADGPAIAFHESSICSKQLGKRSIIVRYFVNWRETAHVSSLTKKLQNQRQLISLL